MILLISKDFCFPPELIGQRIPNPIDATVLYRESTAGGIGTILILLVKIPDWGYGLIFEGSDTLADGIFGQFSDIMNIELAHYLPAVCFDGFDADMQF